MAKRFSISEARDKLPQIAKLLRRSPHEVVLVEHRDVDERLAIVSEQHLRDLESLVKTLKAKLTQPFQLAGSINSNLSDNELEDALKTMREEQKSIAESREKEL